MQQSRIASDSPKPLLQGTSSWSCRQKPCPPAQMDRPNSFLWRVLQYHLKSSEQRPAHHPRAPQFSSLHLAAHPLAAYTTS